MQLNTGMMDAVHSFLTYVLRKPALSACGSLPVIGLVGMVPLLSGCFGSVRQYGHPMEHPCDHQRHGWPLEGTGRQEGREGGREEGGERARGWGRARN